MISVMFGNLNGTFICYYYKIFLEILVINIGSMINIAFKVTKFMSNIKKKVKLKLFVKVFRSILKNIELGVGMFRSRSCSRPKSLDERF